MTFTPTPEHRENPPADDEPGVMLIGGPRGRHAWVITRWITALCVIAGLMVIAFIRFGATVLWAFGLVGFMLGYMAVMARWVSGDHDRRW